MVALAVAVVAAALIAVERAASRHPHAEPPVAASPALDPPLTAVPESTEADPTANPTLLR